MSWHTTNRGRPRNCYGARESGGPTPFQPYQLLVMPVPGSYSPIPPIMHGACCVWLSFSLSVCLSLLWPDTVCHSILLSNKQTNTLFIGQLILVTCPLACPAGDAALSPLAMLGPGGFALSTPYSKNWLCFRPALHVRSKPTAREALYAADNIVSGCM